MKTKIILASIVYFGICVLVFEACCKKKCYDPTNAECSNYDPCYNKKPNAGFKIRVTCWSDFNEAWNYDRIKYVGFSDTVDYAAIDLVADFDSDMEGLKYNWKFDGMSTILHDQTIKDISFYNYTQNPNNQLPLWDSFYTKPIGITLTVTVPASACVGNDTIYSTKRFVTFAKRAMHNGRFKGYFSTNPNKEVEILMTDSVKPFTAKTYYLYSNFPYHENDTIITDDYLFIGSAPFPQKSSYQKYDWSLDLTKPYDLSRLKGILGMSFIGRFNNITQRNEVTFTYPFQKSISDSIEQITFTGYQLQAYRTQL
jgi:hypothetical protein